MADKPLQTFQLQLLELAYDTASSIPLHPHIKDRALTQYQIVVACLELDQPQRALRYGQSIDNWRRGAALADLADYCVRNGVKAEVEAYLSQALEIAATDVDHRRDHIRVKVATVRTLMGDDEKAALLAKGVVSSEEGKTIFARIKSDPDAYDALVKDLETSIATKNFDHVLNAARGYVYLFDTHYGDKTRRQHALDRIKASWEPLTILIRIELLIEMAEVALRHDDTANAKSLIDEAQSIAQAHRWPLEYEVPLIARLAALRHRTGDVKRALTDADAIKAKYEAEHSGLADIKRAAALCPLAQAYHQMGTHEQALVVYRMAVEHGAENPNARPRAIDLAATCRSMAVVGFEPDAQLLARLREIHSKLGVPW